MIRFSRWLVPGVVIFFSSVSMAQAVVDSQAPAVGAVTPTVVASEVATTFTVDYSDPDPSFGMDSCYLVLDGSTTLSPMTMAGVQTGSASIDYTFATPGSHTLQAHCKDVAGHTGDGFLTNITVAAPGTVAAPTPTAVTTGVATTFSAAYSGFNAPFTADSCYFVADGTTVYPAMTLSGGAGSVSGTATKTHTFTGAGSHTIMISCLETAGTYRYSPVTTVNVTAPDTVAPTVGAPSVGGTPAVGAAVMVSATYSDAGSGVASCYLKVNGARQTPDMTLTGGAASGTVTRSYTLGGAGAYDFQVVCTDAAANTATSAMTSINVPNAPVADTVAPSVGNVYPYAALVGTPITLMVNFTDNVGVTQCDLLVNNVAVTPHMAGTGASGTASISYTFLTAGTIPVKARCVDAAGNATIGLDGNVTVLTSSTGPDTTIPSVGAITPTNAMAGVTATLYAPVSDNVRVTSCSLYVNSAAAGSMTLNAAASQASFPYTFASAGTYAVQVRCADAAGNLGFSSASVAVSSPLSGSTPVMGTLVKLECADGAGVNDPCKAVYYYGTDGKRHAFPNEKVYFTWFPTFNGIITVSASFMASLPLGTNVTYHPGIKMVKFITVPTVYAVTRGGVLRPIGSEAIATSLYGSTWNRQIDDMSDAFFTNYTFGSAINTASDYSPTTEVSVASTIDQNR